jgi:predicted DNA-binding transcriptional regulator AlpA
MPAKNDALIPRRKAWREILHISTTTGWRWERDDPKFPKPVRMGTRWYYRMSELQKYIAKRPRKEAA